MRLSSKALWIIAALLVSGLFVNWWIESKSNRELYIALPFVKPTNEITTLEWEPVKVIRPGSGSDGAEHPGYALAKAHCSRCHLFPEPAQLPRETWPFVLTWMSNYLGYTNTYPPFGNNVEGSLVAATPLVSGEDLRTLCEYYMLYSSDGGQHAGEAKRVLDPTVQFTPTVPDLGLASGGLVTLVDFDAERHHLYIGLGHEKVVQVFDGRNRLLLSKTVHSEPVSIETREAGFRMTSMGQFMENTLEGRVVDVVVTEGQVQESTLIEGYHRLTESWTIDLDHDGRSDLLLIGFGAGVEGQVSVRWAGDEAETILVDYAGALNARVHDFDGNGQDDILLLTSQEKQEVLLFLNRGGREFERRLIHQEFAGFGYNHIEHADFDGDGLEDLLIVNGNNMEIKDAPLKPYHGIRIFKNRGDLSFTESYFYPMHGALKALAYDFDGDGDQDIAAIAFYPDWSGETPETFAYLENVGGNTFRSSGLSSEQTGRWISMCLGDLNRDGWEDIVLGAGYILQGVKTTQRDWFSEWARERPSVVVLTNRGRPSSGP